jgi:aspartyl-tRNA(Asn)/glutamyl-tRNA(Gln) amidotransferase subunit A
MLFSSSIGSDTGGSVRNPASICGCIGYKPTYGLISRYGLVPLNNYFDTVGIMAKSVQTIVDVLSKLQAFLKNDVKNKKPSFF